MNVDEYFMQIHYERLHNHNKAKHNKTVCIYLGIYCSTQYNDLDIHIAYEYVSNSYSRNMDCIGHFRGLLRKTPTRKLKVHPDISSKREDVINVPG